MSAAKKIQVGVLYGGQSTEHEVSLQSAKNIIQYLDQNFFDVTPIGIDKQGLWFLGEDVFQKSLQENHVINTPNELCFTPSWIADASSREVTTHLDSTNPVKKIDVVFPAVHGPNCEDGTLQGFLTLANLPYVGCGVLASAIAMDKDISKRLVKDAGIPVANYLTLKYSEWQKDKVTCDNKIENELSFPVFIKPANAGSSVGISKVKEKKYLHDALKKAFQFDKKILIEKALNVLELEIAVLESLDSANDPIVSVVGEIKPTHEFYSYDAKYVDANGATLYIPASVSDDIQQQAKLFAKKIFTLLECEGMARIDLFYDLDTNQLVFNEINTIPGFTKISMYPKLFEASGVSYSDLLTHLIHLALQKQQQKNELTQHYSE